MDELLRRQNSLERNVSESLKQHKDDHAELLSTLRGRLGLWLWRHLETREETWAFFSLMLLFFLRFLWLCEGKYFEHFRTNPNIRWELSCMYAWASEDPKYSQHLPTTALSLFSLNFNDIQWPDFKVRFSVTFCTYMMTSLSRAEGWQERDQPSFGHEADGHRWHKQHHEPTGNWSKRFKDVTQNVSKCGFPEDRFQPGESTGDSVPSHGFGRYWPLQEQWHEDQGRSQETNCGAPNWKPDGNIQTARRRLVLSSWRSWL